MKLQEGMGAALLEGLFFRILEARDRYVLKSLRRKVKNCKFNLFVMLDDLRFDYSLESPHLCVQCWIFGEFSRLCCGTKLQLRVNTPFLVLNFEEVLVTSKNSMEF